MDKKQYITYEIIACSFLLNLIEDADYNPSSALNAMEIELRKSLKNAYKSKVGMSN